MPINFTLFNTGSYLCSFVSIFTQFHIPVPPNPVKARKAAAARAAREAKRKEPAPPPRYIDKEEERRMREEKKKESRRQAMEKANAGITDEEEAQVKKPTKWYMGQYGANEGNV